MPNTEMPPKPVIAETGTVVSLHLHPPQSGRPMLPASELTLVADKGIVEDERYFDRKSRRKVTLIEREQLEQHAAALGVVSFSPGQARSNIETTGISLVSLIGRDVQVGEAVLHFHAPRTPCHQMDALAQGLRELMEDGKQGVLATVVKGGVIHPGDVVKAA